MTPLCPLDKLQWMPDELTDGCNGECVGFAFSDIQGNVIGQQCDLSFTYAAGLAIGGLTPTTGGEDPYAGAASGVIFGALPTPQAQVNLSEPQLEQVNFANYTPAQKMLAATFAQNGIISLTSYAAIANYIQQYQRGVAIGVNWYASWNDPKVNVPNGILPMPEPGEEPISKHEIACYLGTDPRGLAIKAWTGIEGYLFMPQPVFNVCFIEAQGYNPAAWRWWSLVQLALKYPSWATSATIAKVFPPIAS